MALLQYPLLLLGLGGLLWLRARRRGGWLHVLLTLLLALGFWLSVFYGVANHFTGKGIDDATWFHLTEALDWSVIGQFWGLALAAIVTLLLPLWAIRTAWCRWQTHTTGGGRDWEIGAAYLAVVLALWLHPAVEDLGLLAKERYQLRGPDLLAELLAQQHDDAGIQAVRPRSFVYVYMESLDQVFFDQNRFPGLMPRLGELMNAGASIAGLRQAPLTGWTMAGLVSTQCGVPLARAATSDHTGKVLCAGDVLKAHGYELSFMGGAELTFAGKGNFFRLHGFSDVLGGPELDALAGRPLSRFKWGVYDDDLFQLAWQRLDGLANQGKRFGLMLLTVDTHPPAGHETPACQSITYGDGRNKMLNAVHCADHLVAQFLERIRADPRMKDVVVILGSDHLMMANEGGVAIDEENRRNTFVFFNPAFPLSSTDRPATMLDIAPTMLHILGFNVKALGFGRNLYRSDPTLLEKFGADEFFRLIYVWRNALQKRWELAASAGEEG